MTKHFIALIEVKKYSILGKGSNAIEFKAVWRKVKKCIFITRVSGNEISLIAMGPAQNRIF